MWSIRAAKTSIVVAIVVLASAARGDATVASFTRVVVDASMSGDVKALADFDGDGLLDAAIGGSQLVWYAYPSWARHVIGTAVREFTTDMQAADINRDGRPDLVVPDGPDGTNLLWFENRGAGTSWIRHGIGATGNWVHDLGVADFDRDGRLDVVTRRDRTLIFYQNTPTSWSVVDLSGRVAGGEGLAVGDVDRDGDPDLVAAGSWLRNPGGRTTNWATYTIASGRTGTTGVVVDVNGDGRTDVALLPQHDRGLFAWYESSNPAGGAWTSHTIDGNMGSHKLEAGDMNGDGRVDFVAALEVQQLSVYYNGGGGLSWTKQTLSTDGLHNVRVGDFGSDGDLDIFGANYIGSPPTVAWLNQSGGGACTASAP